MTLRALWTYDHVANNGGQIAVTGLAAYTPNNSYNQLTGNPGTPILRSGTSNIPIAAANTAFYGGTLIWTNSTTAAQALVVALSDIPILQNGVTKAYFGFRTVSPLLPLPNTGSVVGVTATPGAVPTSILTEAQLNRTVNVAQYVEVFLDIGNNVYSVWVDGLQLINQAVLPTGWTYLVFGSNAVQTNTGAMGVRDFYFLDADGIGKTTRLGPIQSVMASLAAVTAPNYTSSDGKTALADLTTAYAAVPTATPNISNAPTNDALTATFSTNAAPGSSVVAVQYKMASVVVQSIKLKVQLIKSGAEVDPPAYVFNDTLMQYGRDLAGIQQTDPSGAAWTPASFAATQMVLTPQTLT